MKDLSAAIEEQAYELIRQAGYHPDFWVCQCVDLIDYVHQTDELKCEKCETDFPGNGNASPEEVEEWSGLVSEPIYTRDEAFMELAARVFTDELESLEIDHA